MRQVWVFGAVAATAAGFLGVAANALVQTYTEPIQYCRAVKTIDEPDKRYTGPRVPASVLSRIAEDLKVPKEQVNQGDVSWRCMNGALLACIVTNSGDACAKAPGIDDPPPRADKDKWMFDECKGKRTGVIPGVHGRYVCQNGVPIVRHPNYGPGDVDARGFPTNAWVVVGR